MATRLCANAVQHSVLSATNFSGTGLIAAVLRTQKLIVRKLDATLNPLGLSFPRYEVLSSVDAAPNGVISTALLCRTLDRHPTTITSLIDGLERTKLVTRSTNPADRRETLVTITDRGRAAALSAAHAVDDASAVDTDVLRRLSIDLQALLGATPHPDSRQKPPPSTHSAENVRGNRPA
ncbi:MarR family transcriptional regulator [Rhodococcus sp. WS4]|nr:MarR family transcriptional regulator [Rhodococcus sp. WS4]